MREIPLSQGKVALVDDEDFAFLSQWKWCARWDGNKWYAFRKKQKRELEGGEKYGIVIHMHRVIMNAPPGMEVDHEDGNGLNNQRYNIRLATKSQNQMNKKVQNNSTSGVKGVSFHKLTGKWQGSLKVGSKQKYLGLFNSKEEAALAYNKAASELFGEFAYLNVVGTNSEKERT